MRSTTVLHLYHPGKQSSLTKPAFRRPRKRPPLEVAVLHSALLHTIRTWIAHHAPGRWRTLYLSDAKAFITNLED